MLSYFRCQEKKVVLISKLDIISTQYEMKERPERKRYISRECETPVLSRRVREHAPPGKFKKSRLKYVQSGAFYGYFFYVLLNGIIVPC